VEVPKISFKPGVRDWICEQDEGTHMLDKIDEENTGNINIVSMKVKMRPEIEPEVDEWAEKL
jgi:hypothetical protein